MPLLLSISAHRYTRWLRAFWPLSLFLGLAACAQPAPAPPSATAPAFCESTSRNEGVGHRILVIFQQPTAGDAPAVLARLQAETGACVRFVSGISPTMHAYAVHSKADMGELRARLLRWPAVKAVEADAVVKRH